MSEQLTPRGKRLFIIAMVSSALFLATYYGAPLLNSQTRHLGEVKEHIHQISPQWATFRADHSGFEDVTLFAYTGGDGMFGAYGQVATAEHVSELRRFMESTVPPRPILVDSVRVVGPEFIQSHTKTNKALHPTAR